MNTAVLVLELMLKYGPTVAESAQRILNSKDPTEADWKALFGRAQKSYDQHIAEAQARADAKDAKE